MGQRNKIGFWLARACRKNGLSPPEALAVLTKYRQQVPEPGTYTPPEVKATVSSAYKLRRLA